MRNLGTFSPKWEFFIKYLFSGSENLPEEEKERLKEPKRMEDIKETNPSGCNRIDTHMKLQRPWYHSHGLPRSKPDAVPGLRGEVDTTCIPSP